jgi:DNA-binding transcriptional MocR family regulator
MGGWQSEGSKAPVYRQICQALRLLILDGRLPVGVRLPGERHLASELDVSRTTVASAYAELRELGFIASRHGSGSVTRLPGPARRLTDEFAQPGLTEFSIAALPAPKEVHAAYADALARLPLYLPTPGYEPVGLAELRSAIADRYTRRGAATMPDQILVTQGAQHGLVLALAMLTRPGDQVVVDQPTYAKALEAIANASLRALPVQLPPAGWDVDQLSATLRQTGARIAYLLPDFHNPSGRCMDEFTRARVAKLGAERDCHLIVDETMVDLWIDAPPPPPLAAFDRAGKVISLGSMGKSFWGGIRIGWIRADRELVAAMALQRSAHDMGSPVLEQLAATALLRQTHHGLAERRAQVRARRDHLIRLLRDRLPDWKFDTPPGGLSIWGELPSPLATALAAVAQEHGLRVAPGSRFGVDGALDRFIRLPFALPEEQLDDAIDRLASAWDQLVSGRRSPSAALREALTVAI